MGKECEGQCSCGAKREGRHKTRLVRQPGTEGKGSECEDLGASA